MVRFAVPEKWSAARSLELVVAAQAGDRAARDELIMGNLPYMLKFIKKYTHGRHQTEALLGAATIGMLYAIRKFDVTRGRAFLTYATFWIRAQVHRAMLLESRSIWIPEHVLLQAYSGDEKAQAIVDLVDNVTFVGGRALRNMPNCERSIGTKHRRARHLPESDKEVWAVLPEFVDETFVLIERAEELEWLRLFMATLPDRDRRIVNLRLRGQSMADIGRDLRLSRESIRCILVRFTEAAREAWLLECA